MSKANIISEENMSLKEEKILKKEILDMMQKDFNELQEIISEILRTRDLDKKKLGEAYYLMQRLNIELNKLISLIS